MTHRCNRCHQPVLVARLRPSTGRWPRLLLDPDPSTDGTHLQDPAHGWWNHHVDVPHLRHLPRHRVHECPRPGAAA